MLEGFLAATGYVRRYAIWLLNHAQEILQTEEGAHHRYSPEVQHALVLAWETLNHLCAKRLIPFLPSFLESLQEHGHLQLSEESRRQLLSMSAATADRLLRAHRAVRPRGACTTKAGPLLKQQIPIRTFAHWDEAQPGFLEADLVAHCGGQLQGGCLYTLTLTDIATGWTECLPLLNREREAVLAALQRARTLFPFPILGLDTDNGGEFINEDVAAFCAGEPITFTRGRPYEKRDQCYVEQKNGVVVRQVVGHGRLAGEHAYEQLAQMYRALRLYVNCFQPSMKLRSKQVEGRKIHRTYDVARTPLQRLLLSTTLSPARQQELRTAAKALDPIRLFEQVQRLQQALFRCEAYDLAHQPKAPALVSFDLEGVATELLLSDGRGPDEEGLPPCDQRGREESTHLLNWRPTRKDPFVGQWEQILAWVQADLSRSSGDIFRQLQSLDPRRYRPGHLRTLQRGVRKIRAQLLATREESRPPEVIQADLSTPLERLQTPPAPAETHPRASCCTSPQPGHPLGGETSLESAPAFPIAPAPQTVVLSATVTGQQDPAPPFAKGTPAPPAPHACIRGSSHSLGIERAIHEYVQAHRTARHRPKTLQWHQNVLADFHHFVESERHLLHVSQITEADIHAWIAALSQTLTPAGKQRSKSTIETYARSVRAFCAWLVQQGVLPCSPMSQRSFPQTGVPLPPIVSPEPFAQFLQASCPTASKALTTKRDQALLWVLFETGITLSEVCALRLADLDLATGILSVRGKGGRIRQMALGAACLSALLAYLHQAHPANKQAMARRKRGDDPLFVSEQDRPLSKSSLSSLMNRLHIRAGVSETVISPQNLRHSFALRYLQAGGDPQGLQELMGYEGMAPVRQYLRWHDQLVHEGRQSQTLPA